MYYFIEDYTIYSCEKVNSNYIIFTLEEFFEKFPYKVGDKVIDIKTNRIVEVYKAHWSESNNCAYYDVKLCNNTGYVRSYKFLQPYKEEIMEDYLIAEEDYEKTLEVEQEYIDAAERLMNQLADSTRWKCKDFDSQKMIALFLKKNTGIITEKEDSIIVDIPKGYEFSGIDNDNQKVVFEKIGYQYPKTYEECCEVLEDNFLNVICLSDEEKDLFYNIIKIKRCRDAYWRLYGKQMGLGKPWKQDYNDRCFIITNNNGNIHTYEYHGSNNVILAFPTEEMRDAFYENFRYLIEMCKGLL